MTRKQLDANFFDPSFLEDPYAYYDRIRRVGNVVWNETLGGWVVVGYDEAVAILTDPDRFRILSGDPELTFWFEAPNMITTDGPVHHRLRAALSPLFTRSAAAKWKRRVKEVVTGLLEPLVSGRESFDLIEEFTVLPTLIVSEMLGVPDERHDDFQRWSHDIVTNLAFGMEDETSRKILRRAATEINAYLVDEIERHQRDRPDDLITHMLDLEGDRAMSTDEIRSTAVLLLAAGYDTTAKAMSNTLIALERHRDQRREVADDLSLVPAAIEESLRWLGPVQWNPRRAAEDVDIDGSAVTAGETMYVMTAAANRDPRRWPDPTHFDVHREGKSHLGFGHGAHLCLGAPLARIETQVAVEELLRVAPEYKLRDLDFGRSMFIRGPERGVVDVGVAADH